MPSTAELRARSVLGQAEAFALLGRYGGEVVRRPDAIGSRILWAETNHWGDAAVVPPGVDPPADDDAGLPHCLWVCGSWARRRTELPEIAMPVMAFDLAGAGAPDPEVGTATPAEVGALNDLAYGEGNTALLLGAVPADALHIHALREGDGIVACATCLDLGDDASVQWVATHPAHRRQGLASRVLHTLMAGARERGRTHALLQASPDGEPLYEHLGFETIGRLRAFVRRVS